MTRFFFVAGLALVLMIGTHLAWKASSEGRGLDDEFADVSVRNGSTHRGTRVFVGGGFHGGK